MRIRLPALALAALPLLAAAPASHAESKFRLVETKALAKGIQVCLAHECGPTAEDVTLTLFSDVPWHDQIRTVASGKQVGHERNPNARGTVVAQCQWSGTGTAKVTIPYARLEEIGVAAQGTAYLCGFWPKYNHVWGYGFTAKTEVPVVLPARKAQQNARFQRAPGRPRWGRPATPAWLRR